MITRDFDLWITQGHTKRLVFNANQYDQGETWRFRILGADGNPIVPTTAAIIGQKKDGHAILVQGTVSDGKVVITETEQMTACAGLTEFELLLNGETHGTANFTVQVEKRPGDDADLSDSDLSLIQDAVDAASEIEDLLDGQDVPTVITPIISDWLDENITNPSNPPIDTSLTVAGAAADAKATGDEITDLKSAIEQGGGGLTNDVKQALLQIAQKVAYIDEHGQNYYDDLYDALYPEIVVTNITLNQNSLSFESLNTTQQLTAITTPRGGVVTWTSSNPSVATVNQTGLVTSIAYGNATITATSGDISARCSVIIAQVTVTDISVSYTQSGDIYDTDSIDILKNDIDVTATWSDGTTSSVTADEYILSGTLTAGQSTITVSYGGRTTTFNVNVTANTLNSITATFNQSSNIIYDTDSLDTLKRYLVVTALYEDGSSPIISSDEYVLNGELVEGTCTITVSYNEKVTTFTVTVTHDTSITINWSDTATYSLDSTGEVKSGNDYVSDFIQINEEGTYEFVDDVSKWYVVHIYDANKQHITQYSTNSPSIPICKDFNSDGYFVKLDVWPSGDTVYTTPDEMFHVQKLNRTWSYNVAKFNTTNGKFIPLYVERGSNRCKYAYVPVTPNTYYRLSNIGTLNATFLAIYEYDSNKNFIKYTEMTAGDTSVITSENTHYVRYSVYAPSATNETNMDEQISFETVTSTTLYELPQATIFNGTSDFIDTNLALMSDTHDFTVMFDADIASTQVNSRGTFAHCMHEVSPYYGFTIDLLANTGKLHCSVPSATSANDVRGKNIKVVLTRLNDRFTYYYYVDGTVYSSSSSGPYNHKVNESLIIGAYQSSSGTKDRFFTGTINDFKVIDSAVTANFANEYFGSNE